MGTWTVLDDIVLADCALSVEGRDLADLFETAARALVDVMVDPATVARDVERHLELQAETLDGLLYDWLAELVVMKDSEQLVFADTVVSVRPSPPSLDARLRGGRIDRARTILRADVKAVTFHEFALVPQGAGWRARIVLDI
jgi:SHS2 domain-containing protein